MNFWICALTGNSPYLVSAPKGILAPKIKDRVIINNASSVQAVRAII